MADWQLCETHCCQSRRDCWSLSLLAGGQVGHAVADLLGAESAPHALVGVAAAGHHVPAASPVPLLGLSPADAGLVIAVNLDHVEFQVQVGLAQVHHEPVAAARHRLKRPAGLVSEVLLVAEPGVELLVGGLADILAARRVVGCAGVAVGYQIEHVLVDEQVGTPQTHLLVLDLGQYLLPGTGSGTDQTLAVVGLGGGGDEQDGQQEGRQHEGAELSYLGHGLPPLSSLLAGEKLRCLKETLREQHVAASIFMPLKGNSYRK